MSNFFSVEYQKKNVKVVVYFLHLFSYTQSKFSGLNLTLDPVIVKKQNY